MLIITGEVFIAKGVIMNVQEYNRAIVLNPNDAVFYFNRATVYNDMGNYDLARQDYDKAIELNPIYVEAYINRGNIYTSKGNHDLARQDYDKANKINPHLVDTIRVFNMI